MRARVIVPAAAPEDLVEGWRALAGRAVEPNPFFEPDYVLAAAAHLADGDACRVVLIEDGDAVVAAAPVTTSLGGPTRSWVHDYAYLGTPLLDAERADAALAALLEAMAALGPSRLVHLRWVDGDGGVGDVLTRVLRAFPSYATESFERAVLRRLPSGEAPVGLSKERARSLRRRGKTLAEALGGEPVLVDHDDDEDALEVFLRLEAAGWKGREGTALTSRQADGRFFREMARRFRQAGRLRLTGLEHEGRVAAMQCSLVAGEGLFQIKTAFDEELSRGSPGVQLAVELARRFDAGPGPAWVDSCAAPEAELYNELFPGRRRLVSYVTGDRGLRGRAAVAATGRLRSRNVLKG